MYVVAVRREFMAQHYLIGGDWGAENQRHTHHYVLELRLSGSELDRHGYLVDIIDIERSLDGQVALYRDRTLNELETFAGVNPSLERFARVLCVALSDSISAANVRQVSVRLWEHANAWAEYHLER